MTSKAQKRRQRQVRNQVARASTPDAEDACLNRMADERASGPFVAVSLDDLTREG